MRCVQNRSLGYIFSPWSDGKFVYRNNNEGMTMRAMVQAAKTDPRVVERVRMFRYRVFEELYDLGNDPDCLNNLAGKPERKDDLDRMRNELHAWMKRTHDPLLPAFENRADPEKIKAVLTSVYGQNYTRAAQGRQNAARRQKDEQE
jgi:N-sulfoglucosamine sulfohydrolase